MYTKLQYGNYAKNGCINNIMYIECIQYLQIE